MMATASILVGSIAILFCLGSQTAAEEPSLSADEINLIEASLGQHKRQHPPLFSPVDPDQVPSIPGLCPENGYDKTTEDCEGSQQYRTFDGSCNNLVFVNWGKAIGPLARFMDPAYGDGKSSPRRASDGSQLPNTRRISSMITVKHSPASDKYTALVMSFGQFLDHDFALSPEKLTVCTNCSQHGECDPIHIEDDYYYTKTKCLHFTRSRRVKPANCAEFPEEQQNIVSSYIDLSQVYGTSEEIVNLVRDRNSDLGLLRSVPNPRYPTRKEYLPFDDNNVMCAEDGDIKCGFAGDFRAPEQVGLTSLHTMFIREHNRVARELATINPHWDGERLYQEARRILIGIWQNIVFGEYVHLLIGTEMANIYNLFPRSFGRMYNHYDPIEDATILNEFSTACFRMGHSMIPPSFLRVDKYYNEVYGTLELNYAFFNATHIFDFDQGGMDSISLGLTASPLMKVDNFFTKMITNQLFANPAEGPGSDLVAINIKRGRDHGIPGYTAVLRKCSNKVVDSFDDLSSIPDDVIEKFKVLYKSVHDIDLFIGGTAEEPLPGANVGPTFACVIGLQFKKFKYGDRFWFENAGYEGEFTTDQVTELRKASLARIFCDNLDNIETIQPKVLLKPDEGFIGHEETSEPTDAPDINNYFGNQFQFFPRPKPAAVSNKRVNCSNTGKIPNVNLAKWKE